MTLYFLFIFIQLLFSKIFISLLINLISYQQQIEYRSFCAQLSGNTCIFKSHSSHCLAGLNPVLQAAAKCGAQFQAWNKQTINANYLPATLLLC